MRKFFILFILLLSVENILPNSDKTPFDIGVQIFIEPGQKIEDIENWFRISSEAGISTCRIRLFEEYIRKDNGQYDFTLFDKAIAYAKKYNIKVFLTLFPEGENRNTLGGFKYPASEAHLMKISRFIEKVVNHYKNNETVYAWVLLNEAGGNAVPNSDITRNRFAAWKSEHSGYLQPDGGYRKTGFEWNYFVRDYNTWYLGWIANEIRRYDTKKDLHVNTHQIFNNIKEYDFPGWRNFLSSLGASAHPSWHFSYFNRDQYALALSANCEIMKSGAGDLPFYITELQGGNNTYSGENGFCPTKEEITQWLWTGIGSGAKKILFWTLNSRSSGEEAGEWSLLNFMNEPSDRLTAVSKVTQCLMAHKEMFSGAVPIKSPIMLLYNKESLWIENAVCYGSLDDERYEGKHEGAVMKSLATIYETLAGNGVKSGIGDFDEYNWSLDDYSGMTIILSHQIAIPNKHLENIRKFVRNGGKLIVEGLTGFYDEYMRAYPNMGFPLNDVLGGYWSEVICYPGDFEIALSQKIPAHLWKSFIKPTSGIPLATENDKVIAMKNKYGKGDVLWIPAMVALGARRSGDYEPLSSLLMKEIGASLSQFPFYFSSYKQNLLMETMQTNDGIITIIINNEDETRELSFFGSKKDMIPSLIFPVYSKKSLSFPISVKARETLVIKWKF